MVGGASAPMLRLSSRSRNSRLPIVWPERVHRPRRMVEREDPCETAPEDAADEAVNRLGRKTADDTGNDDAEPAPARSSGR